MAGAGGVGHRTRAAVIGAMGLSVVIGTWAVSAVGSANQAYGQEPTPISHVVIFFQENHSFDNVLGVECRKRATPCDGAVSGKLSSGKTIKLAEGPDVVPQVDHTTAGQLTAINHGKMNGFDKISGCTKTDNYRCYSLYGTKQVPNIAALASTFAVSDRTFESATVPSYGAHLELATTTLDGFTGANGLLDATGPGWGSDSGGLRQWKGPSGFVYEPSCIPAPAGSPEVSAEPPAVQASPVKWVPTIMDRLDAAGLSWDIYAAGSTDINYEWNICPYFADCLYTSQVNSVKQTTQVVADASAGTLPNVSILLPASGPSGSTSCHNNDSMTVCDDWIGQVVSAIENGPDWNSTAIFLTWDDCGCFYDHVPPPKGDGVRVPMIIISPYAKPGYTDSTVSTFASMLAFIEHNFGVAPLSNVDAKAYDYMNSFDFSQTPIAPVAMVQRPEPATSKAYIKAHPADPDDPT